MPTVYAHLGGELFKSPHHVTALLGVISSSWDRARVLAGQCAQNRGEREREREREGEKEHGGIKNIPFEV